MRKQILSAAMSLLLAAGLPVTAFAQEYDLAKGSIDVSANDDGNQYVSQTANSIENEQQTSPTVIKQTDSDTTSTLNTVTITAEKNQTAEVTLKDINIDQSMRDKAAVSTEGSGNVVIELDGENTAKSGAMHAGVEKNNTGNLTITDTNGDGSLTAVGRFTGAGIGGGGGGEEDGTNITIAGGTINAIGDGYGAGIGGGSDANGSNITISGGDVTATSRSSGAGIGGGAWGKGSNIKVSGDAKLKVQGGKTEGGLPGKGADIGDGGSHQYIDKELVPKDGAEIKPDISRLTPDGQIEYYDQQTGELREIVAGTYIPGEEDNVVITPAQQANAQLPQATEQNTENTSSVSLYRVTDSDNKDISYVPTQQDGVLTIAVDTDLGVLTGTLEGISILKTQGVEKIVFVTRSAASSFALSDLLTKGAAGETYRLTHSGATVTFTLGAGNIDVSDILNR